ncbi:TPA: filamentous hemagglutinin N-terminal domain-containing protein [Burkholderia vietnamiensis]|uniref:two-partner secretion domain-containing protein n=1 Tax=Burkholderia vietnamiensis TaxID=60552 RepID=UPI001D1517C5|nr:filamentous hemagglutinin N-terminal domain-containing protein [Burkholderia vietnamiensis]UEC05084.1 filamentous hemagglutinin N-terminal domain-containing protein [Burkholderia vietnamiensis]HDR8991152.1 filamentous hemagglutinin N-terminal domain-containing protein [Burkholderia vietnamiensis]HDR9062582.1 filamentous hemagglutinin N-terminal domain-containing protein [Burkholderia vietnamiensis]
MRRLMRELECRCLQREARKRAIIFDRSSQSSGGHALWVKATAWVMSVVMYLGPAVLLADEAAYAAPIVDPRAPIAFQPSVTQTSAGVPAINIPAANANGISVGQYQSFDIDSRGLVLNNSTIAGTPLLGGTLGANPNLNGRPATTIINQVTSSNIATLNGPLEVFGAPAAVIVSAPGGVSVNGMALTNVPGLTLTTGVPQFLTGVGGSATDFAHAGAVGYDVRSGNISINGPAGVNGPGAGIEGTVGNIDLIGQSVTLAAPLRADQRVNVVTGNQLVTPTASDSSGATYGTAANGVVNTAAAIGKGIAVDASQYGSVTSGTVYIVSTAAGMGVNTQGPMSATAGNVVVNANGDISVGKTFANQNVNLTSTGTTTITDTGLANRNYTVAANGDINAAGAVSAGQNVSMTAGGNLNAASVAANGAASLTAGQSMSIGSLSAHDIALQTASGDLTVGGLSAPGRVSAKAGRDLTVSGAVQGGSAVALAGARNVIVNGQVSSVGATTIAAQTGSASVNGNVTSGAALSVAAGGNTSVQGTAASIGDMTLAANGGLLTTTGNVASLGALTATGQQGVNLGGTVYSGGNASIGSGAGSVTVGGAVSTPGALNINAGQDATVAGTVQSGQTATIAATRDANLNGGLSVDNAGNANVTAGRDINGTGAISVANDTTLNAGNNVGVSGAIQTGNSLNVSAGKNLSVGATTAVGNSTLSATNGSVTLAGNALAGGVTTITAGTDINTQGSVESLGDLSVSAKSGNLNASSPVSTAGNANLNAGQNLTLNGPTTVSKNASLTAANITTQNVAVGGNLTAAATSNLDTSAGQLNQPFSAIARLVGGRQRDAVGRERDHRECRSWWHDADQRHAKSDHGRHGGIQGRCDAFRRHGLERRYANGGRQPQRVGLERFKHWQPVVAADRDDQCDGHHEPWNRVWADRERDGRQQRHECRRGDGDERAELDDHDAEQSWRDDFRGRCPEPECGDGRRECHRERRCRRVRRYVGEHPCASQCHVYRAQPDVRSACRDEWHDAGRANADGQSAVADEHGGVESRYGQCRWPNAGHQFVQYQQHGLDHERGRHLAEWIDDQRGFDHRPQRFDVGQLDEPERRDAARERRRAARRRDDQPGHRRSGERPALDGHQLR